MTVQRRRIRRDRGVGKGSFSGIAQLCSLSAAIDRLAEYSEAHSFGGYFSRQGVVQCYNIVANYSQSAHASLARKERAGI